MPTTHWGFHVAGKGWHSKKTGPRRPICRGGERGSGEESTFTFFVPLTFYIDALPVYLRASPNGEPRLVGFSRESQRDPTICRKGLKLTAVEKNSDPTPSFHGSSGRPHRHKRAPSKLSHGWVCALFGYPSGKGKPQRNSICTPGVLEST